MRFCKTEKNFGQTPEGRKKLSLIDNKLKYRKNKVRCGLKSPTQTDILDTRTPCYSQNADKPIKA